MSLGFKTLPMVFAQMPGGNFFGAAFFLILFLAAITSSLSMLQPTKAFFEEALGVNKGVSTTMVTIWGLLGNFMVLWFSKDGTVADTLDFWVGSFLILVVAAVQIIAFGWIFGLERGVAEAHEGAQMPIPKFFRFVIKYVSPAYLLVVIGGFCWNNLPDPKTSDGNAVLNGDGTRKLGELSKILENGDVQIGWAIILATITGLVVITAIGARRWHAEGRDLDGLHPAKD
jgi:extradiol dioxygenase family protein